MTSPPYRLRTFSGLAIESDAGPVPLDQRRKSLALLAVVAAHETGVSRDRLLAMFWPESDADRARNALYQVLHGIRRELGDVALIGGAALQLNPDIVASDLHAFRASITDRAFEDAMRLYAGPFLDGVFIKDAPEFERWTDEVRAELRRQTELALETLAKNAAQRGDHRGAADHWRRFTELDPTSSRAAAGLIEALAAIGERTAALEFVRAHERLLREELDVAPAPEVLALAQRLRASGPAGGSHGPYLAHVRAALAPLYEVRERLQHGTLTTQFTAYERGANRHVVLKVVHPAIVEAMDAECFVRTLREASTVQHERLLTLLNAAVVGGVTFYAMPAFEGESLRDRLARERLLPISDAVTIAADVADALSAAHARGMYHMDVKPRHVICCDGRAMLAELGLATALKAAEGNDITASGVVSVGTPAYMSPEQASSDRRVDARGDIYSLGCVLYHMLAGEPPFAGSSPHTIVAQRLTNAVASTRTFREDVPRELDAIVLRMLARNPDDRFASASELRDALFSTY